MPRNQPQNQNLVIVTVPPGSVTGLYYITIANFSRNTTWKDLKEFVSRVCEVDFCLTYDPTAGFVRVKGLENFEKAHKYLNGNTLHDRCLQADARNRDQPTVVKLPPSDYHAILLLKQQHTGRVVDEPSAPQPPPVDPSYSYPGNNNNNNPADMRRNSEYTSPTAQYASPTDHWGYPVYTNNQDYPAYTNSQNYPAVTSPVTTSSGYQDFSSSFSTAGSAGVYPPYGSPGGAGPSYYDNNGNAVVSSSPTYFHPTTTNMTNLPSMTTLTNDFSDLGFNHHSHPHAAAAAAAAGHHPDPYPNPPPTTTTTSDQPQTPVVALENRKIILLGLGKRNVSETSVLDLLATFCGGVESVAGQVEKIEITIGRKTGEAIGTAFVTFRSAEVALGAIKSLDRAVMWGRMVTARMAEGLVSGEVSAAGGVNHLVALEKRERRRLERMERSSGSGGGKEGAPVVVDGSRRGKEREREREGAPVIVDGSGGRGRGRGSRS
ncbi:hypothetical protein B0T21DRAFT_413016 [Apiosordaria backusii]|uniref:RRM domain-containing protein n=1 Tax=Apiosordaria backusii TaxID=314023 RepID=A0AA40BF89_9PEZI|nr:hypothetical protein B0T21DRAFT_413016 [Apiosordaria backusii]